MVVIVAPLFVLSAGTAGGFRRLAGVGGADLRWVVPDCVFELLLKDELVGRLLAGDGGCGGGWETRPSRPVPMESARGSGG